MKHIHMTANELREHYPNHLRDIDNVLREFRAHNLRDEPTLDVVTACPVSGAHLTLRRSESVERFAHNFMIDIQIVGYAWDKRDEETTHRLLTTPTVL